MLSIPQFIILIKLVNMGDRLPIMNFLSPKFSLFVIFREKIELEGFSSASCYVLNTSQARADESKSVEGEMLFRKPSGNCEECRVEATSQGPSVRRLPWTVLIVLTGVTTRTM